MTVRSFFRAAKVESAEPPYDTIHLKVLYPARTAGNETEHNRGFVPADSDQAPFPVVIFFSGFNCGPEMYQWLAIQLAEQGLVVVTFAWVAENRPGTVGLTPGIDTAMWTPATYGTGPTASALPALLAELERLQAQGVLAGLLDLQKVVLGGHSAGGRVAIESADPRFFPQVTAAFAYGSHTAGLVMLGHEPGKILPLAGSLPLLLMGGTCDGVIAKSSDRYDISPADTTTPVVRTFKEAFAGGRNDAYLVLFEGANHFSITDPNDPTTGSSLVDFPATQLEDEIRSLMVKAISLFINAHVRHQPEVSQALDQLLTTDSPLIKFFERR